MSCDLLGWLWVRSWACSWTDSGWGRGWDRLRWQEGLVHGLCSRYWVLRRFLSCRKAQGPGLEKESALPDEVNQESWRKVCLQRLRSHYLGGKQQSKAPVWVGTDILDRLLGQGSWRQGPDDSPVVPTARGQWGHWRTSSHLVRLPGTALSRLTEAGKVLSSRVLVLVLHPNDVREISQDLVFLFWKTVVITPLPPNNLG